MTGRVALLLGLLPMAALPACGADPVDAPTDRGRVVEIVDGDTLDVAVAGRRERVRLTGIDTPEVARRGGGRAPAPAECYADEATAFLADLIPPGTAVRLVRDVVPRDHYGRLLAYVHRADDDLLVNVEIVRRGYGLPLSIPPNVALAPAIADAAHRAERAEAGLWSACTG